MRVIASKLLDAAHRTPHYFAIRSQLAHGPNQLHIDFDGGVNVDALLQKAKGTDTYESIKAILKTIELEPDIKDIPPRLYVDMDGTLATFRHVQSIDELYEKGYFLNLPPQCNVLLAIKSIIENHPEVEVNILSSYLTDSHYAFEEKKKWLRKFLPELPAQNQIFVPYGEPKEQYIKYGLRATDVLLDDYTHNLTGWCPPGTGIKILNGINHTNESWQHHCISYLRKPQELADAIIHVIRTGELVKDEKPNPAPDNQCVDHALDDPELEV